MDVSIRVHSGWNPCLPCERQQSPHGMLIYLFSLSNCWSSPSWCIVTRERWILVQVIHAESTATAPRAEAGNLFSGPHPPTLRYCIASRGLPDGSVCSGHLARPCPRCTASFLRPERQCLPAHCSRLFPCCSFPDLAPILMQ